MNADRQTGYRDSRREPKGAGADFRCRWIGSQTVTVPAKANASRRGSDPESAAGR
jgi:hypothetical protein